MIDTRDLLEKREDLKATILADFNEKYPKFEVEDFEDIVKGSGELEHFNPNILEDFQDEWYDELEVIKEIDNVEDSVGKEFEYGVTLIEEDDFVDYCKELVSDCGDLPKDLPWYIESNINWEGVADYLKSDYSEVEYNEDTYLFRV